VTRLGVALVLLASAAIYLPGLPGDFVYDDYRLIVRNEGLRRPFDPARAFLRDYYASDFDHGGLGYYRPIAILSNEIDYRLGGGGSLPFHATNIAIHVASTALLMLMARMLWPRASSVMLGAGLLFALHPAHAESVAFISGRVDPLATLFVLAALAAHLRGTAGWSATAAGLWLCALLSKEMAITMPVLAVVLDAARNEPRELARRYRGFAVAFVIYLVLRLGALGGLDPGSPGGAFSLVRPFATMGAYLLWLFVPPFGLHLEPEGPAGALAGLMALALVIFAIVAGALWRRGLRLEPALMACAAIALLPVSQVRVLETAMSERFLYLPSAFIAIAIASSLAGARMRRTVIAIVLLLAAVYATNLYGRVTVWRDEVALWSEQTRVQPRSVRAWVSLAHAQVRRGDRDAALRAYEQLRTLGMDPAVLGAEMASTLGAAGDPDEEQTLLRAIEVTPGDAALWQNLGFARLGKGDADGAREAFVRAVEIVPARSSGWIGLAFAELRRGSYREALDAADRAAALDPTLAIARAIRGECRWRLGDPCGAVADLDGLGLADATEAEAARRVLARAREDCSRISK
jgi:tetratricopeptide (TPR) repeat protein